MNWLKLAWSGFVKDFRLEFRTRYAVNAILMFAVISLAAISFAVGPTGMDKQLSASFFWIIIFFSSMTGLSHIFVREVEQRTDFTLRIFVRDDVVFWSKFLFNFVLTLILELIIVPLFFFWFTVDVAFFPQFMLTILVASIGLSTVSTLIAAIISQAGSKSALFAILSFPILLPLLIMAIKASILCFWGIKLEEIYSLQISLLAYDGLMLFVAPLLFKFIWRTY